MGHRWAPPGIALAGASDPGRGRVVPDENVRYGGGDPDNLWQPVGERRTDSRGGPHRCSDYSQTNTADARPASDSAATRRPRRRGGRHGGPHPGRGGLWQQRRLGHPTTKATTTTVAIDPATATGRHHDRLQHAFNLSNPSLPGKIAVIQDGSQVSPALQQALSSSEASAAQGAKIDSVNILTAAQCAKQSLPSPVRPRGLRHPRHGGNGHPAQEQRLRRVHQRQVARGQGDDLHAARPLLHRRRQDREPPGLLSPPGLRAPRKPPRTAAFGSSHSTPVTVLSERPCGARAQALLGRTAVASPTTFTSPSPLARLHSSSTRLRPSSTRLPVTTILVVSSSPGQVWREKRTL